jgi:PAS domain S-box-containing protein
MKFEHLDGLAQALFEETGDAMVFFDPETQTILDANSTTQRLSGFSIRELLHMQVHELYQSATEEDVEKMRRASRKTAIFHAGEGYFLRTVKGGRIPVNLTMARLHLRAKTLGLITARDVRKQYEAHAQLRSMEAELQRLMALVCDCLWSAKIDKDGKCVYHYFSPVVEKLTGLPPTFFLDGIHRWWSVVHPEDQARWTRAHARQRARQSTTEEYRITLPDGSSRWVRECVQASQGTAEGGDLRLDGVLTDITERKKIEADLQESEERFRAFLDNSPALAFLKDVDGRYCYVNQPFQKVLGRSAEELFRKTDFDLFPAEVAQRIRDNDDAVFKTNQPLRIVETLAIADGLPRSWLVSRFPWRDNSGRRFVGALALEVTSPLASEAESRPA